MASFGGALLLGVAGVAHAAPPATTLVNVDGNIAAESFTGDGANLEGVATDAELAAHAADADAHQAPEGNVVLWNKLGSDQEVQLGEIGVGGIIVGSDYAYEPALFASGYVRTNAGSWLEFPATVLNGLRQRGAVELWITPKVPEPVPYVYGFFALLGQSDANHPANRGHVWLIWGDGVTGRGFVGGVHFGDDATGSIPAITQNEPAQFVATPGVPVHAAIVWNIDGIDKTPHTVRVYRDGALVGWTSNNWVEDGTRAQTIILGVSPDAGYDRFITDNIIVYDYPKTDFSDRYEYPSL